MHVAPRGFFNGLLALASAGSRGANVASLATGTTRGGAHFEVSSQNPQRGNQALGSKKSRSVVSSVFISVIADRNEFSLSASLSEPES